MATSLFESPIFGPINSRRLGISLGINLLPQDGKVCSFNCLYCECGLNEERRSLANQLPTRKEVREKLSAYLKQMSQKNKPLDVITFAGNGEPTLHPDFSSIIDDVIALKDQYYPNVKISVLSNAAHLDRAEVFEGLSKIDNNILKLDSANESTFMLINNANSSVKFEDIVPNMARFEGRVIVQTLFCQGENNGIAFDNTTEFEILALIEAYKKISPEKIMIYSLSRDTPVNSIFRIEKQELELIANRLRLCGFIVDVA